MITPNQIKTYVNNKLDINICNKRRTREVVYGRALFSKLCLDYCVNERNKAITISEIGNYINKSHCTIIHYLDNVFPIFKEQDKKIYEIYTNFSTVEKFEDDVVIKKLYKDVSEENANLKLQIEYLKSVVENNEKTLNNEFLSVLNSVQKDKLDLFYLRIKPIAKMLNSHIVY